MNPASLPATGVPGGAPVLTAVQHGDDVPLDRLAGWLTAAGAEVVVVAAHRGDPVPAAGEVGDGLVVLGGEMSAFDDTAAPWLPAVRALLADAARSGVPTLGICLGAQLLARATGGAVQVAAPPGLEAGVVAVRWRGDALTDPLLGQVARAAGETRRTPMPSMHADAVVDLPRGAVWLASSETYPYQAFRIGSAWGLQFHPEASPQTMAEWARSHPEETDPAAIQAEMTGVDEAVGEAGMLMAAAFVELARARREQRGA